MNINILHISSAEHERFSLGLYSNNKITIQSYKCPIGTMSDKILSDVDKFLIKNHLKLKQINCIVVYQGPGSYTSLRIGISMANALAFALDIPIVSIKNKQKFDNQFIKKISCSNGFKKPINPHYQQAI